MKTTTVNGHLINVEEYKTALAAKKSMSAAQRKTYNARVFSFKNSEGKIVFDIFPQGHPIPKNAVLVK